VPTDGVKCKRYERGQEATECNPGLFEFARVEGRAVMASFDDGRMTSDAGAVLLGADRVIGLTPRLAGCFTDTRGWGCPGAEGKHGCCGVAAAPWIRFQGSDRTDKWISSCEACQELRRERRRLSRSHCK